MEYPEPVGYFNLPGFVKSNPKNNDTYVEKACQAYPAWADIIRDTHAKLTELVPGYNISQIKEKFWALRYYISCPDDADPDTQQQAWEIVRNAEAIAPPLNKG